MGIFRNLGDKFGLVVVLFRDDIDLEVDCLDDIQPLVAARSASGSCA